MRRLVKQGHARIEKPLAHGQLLRCNRYKLCQKCVQNQNMAANAGGHRAAEFLKVRGHQARETPPQQ